MKTLASSLKRGGIQIRVSKNWLFISAERDSSCDFTEKMVAIFEHRIFSNRKRKYDHIYF
jgi:hypothetical protein